jgi:hypothetical protein
MEDSPFWETNSSSASHEIPHVLQNQNVCQLIHKSLILLSVLSHIKPVHAPQHTPPIPFLKRSAYSKCKYRVHFPLLIFFQIFCSFVLYNIKLIKRMIDNLDKNLLHYSLWLRKYKTWCPSRIYSQTIPFLILHYWLS